MPEDEEQHVYGVCQQCGESLRFPLRGVGTISNCPHCQFDTELRIETFRANQDEQVFERPATEPPTVVKPKVSIWKTQRGAIIGCGLFVVCVSILIIAMVASDPATKNEAAQRVAGVFGGGIVIVVGMAAVTIVVIWIVFPFLVLSRMKAQEKLLRMISTDLERSHKCHDSTATNAHAIAVMLKNREQE